MPFPDEEKMDIEAARELVAHVDEQWPLPLTFDERQAWGKALMELDVDYSVAAITAAKVAMPEERPSIDIFRGIYVGVVQAAHTQPELPVEPAPKPEAVTGRAAIERIRAENNLGHGPAPKSRPQVNSPA